EHPHERRPVKDEAHELPPQVGDCERRHPEREPHEHERMRGRHADRDDHRCRRQHPDHRRANPYHPHPATLESVSMTVSTIDHALLIDGQQVETGAWSDVASPYSGELIGRIATGGAAEARRALDAADRALRAPLPAHERARIL